MMQAKRITCLLIDDDPLAIQQFKYTFRQSSHFELLGSFRNPEDFKFAVARCPPDILFLDVEMPDMNGLDLAKEIIAMNIRSKLVFVTGFKKYAFDAIKISPFSYLMKPVTPADLKKLATSFYIDKSTFQGEVVVDKIRFNTSNGFLMLDPKKIMSIQADGNYSITTMDSGQTHLLTCTLKRIAQQLDFSDLVRISRSLILNVNYLSFVDRRNQKCRLESEKHVIEIPLQKIAIKKLAERLGQADI